MHNCRKYAMSVLLSYTSVLVPQKKRTSIIWHAVECRPLVENEVPVYLADRASEKLQDEGRKCLQHIIASGLITRIVRVSKN